MVEYSPALKELSKLPPVTISFEKTQTLSVGFPPLLIPDTYSLSLMRGDSEEETTTGFTTKVVEGGTWYEYYRTYSSALRKWLVLMGCQYSKQRFVLLDTSDPTSILAIKALPTYKEVVVMAVAADENSTLINQNTSYAALKVIEDLSLPVVLTTRSFLEDCIAFVEGEGLYTRSDAVAQIFSILIASADRLMSSMRRDEHLGVRMHLLSSVVSGSKAVYKTVESAMKAQLATLSGLGDAEIQTVSVFASGPREMQDEIVQETVNLVSGRFKQMLNVESSFVSKESIHKLFDILVLYGVTGERQLDGIRNGYDAVARRSRVLAVESVK